MSTPHLLLSLPSFCSRHEDKHIYIFPPKSNFSAYAIVKSNDENSHGHHQLYGRRVGEVPRGTARPDNSTQILAIMRTSHQIRYKIRLDTTGLRIGHARAHVQTVILANASHIISIPHLPIPYSHPIPPGSAGISTGFARISRKRSRGHAKGGPWWLPEVGGHGLALKP